MIGYEESKSWLEGSDVRLTGDNLFPLLFERIPWEESGKRFNITSRVLIKADLFFAVDKLIKLAALWVKKYLNVLES